MKFRRAGALFGAVSLAAVVLLAGCPSSMPRTPAKTDAAGDKDDAAAVAALKEHKATLETDSEGRVVKVDLDSAAGGNADLELLKGLPSVRDLDCTEARGVTDAGLAKLAGHPSLRSIKLERTNVTDAGMAHLQKVPHLEDLDVRRTGITAAGYKEIGKNHLTQAPPRRLEFEFQRRLLPGDQRPQEPRAARYAGLQPPHRKRIGRPPRIPQAPKCSHVRAQRERQRHRLSQRGQRPPRPLARTVQQRHCQRLRHD